MRALTLVADRKLKLADMAAPPAPGAGEVEVRIKAVGLNHIDLWGYRGMAFVKRKLPLVVGAEAAGEVTAVGAGVSALAPGDPVVMYGALTCGTCKACREGRDNLCENVGGIMGFHVDGFARDAVTMPERLVIKAPAGIAMRDLACAPIALRDLDLRSALRAEWPWEVHPLASPPPRARRAPRPDARTSGHREGARRRLLHGVRTSVRPDRRLRRCRHRHGNAEYGGR